MVIYKEGQTVAKKHRGKFIDHESGSLCVCIICDLLYLSSFSCFLNDWCYNLYSQ